MPAKIIFTEAQKANILKVYNECRSTRKTAAIIGVDRHTIQKVLILKGVELAGPAEHNKLPVDSSFFDVLTPASSYYLGLFVADGCISSATNGNSVTFDLSLKSDDAYIIEKLRDLIAPQHRLIIDKGNTRLRVGDSALCMNVVQWGIRWKRKSYELGRCLELFDALNSANCTNHFVRGFIDGDGCVCLSKKYGNESVTAVGTKEFLTSLKDIININVPESGGSLLVDKRESIVIPGWFLWVLEFTGKVQTLAICDWLYKDKGSLFLTRKYRKYEELMLRS